MQFIYKKGMFYISYVIHGAFVKYHVFQTSQVIFEIVGGGEHMNVQFLNK